MVVAALTGDYGKVRPMLVIQPPEFLSFDSLIICPLTSNTATEGAVRVRLEPTQENGLEQTSLIMIEKLGAIDRKRIRTIIGTISEEQIAMVDERLALILGLAP